MLFRTLTLTALLALASACGEDPLGNDDGDSDSDKATSTENSDDANPNPVTNGGKPVDGNAMTGQINGKDWTLITGSARIYKYSSSNTTSTTIRLFGTAEQDPCSYSKKRSWTDAGYVEVSMRVEADETSLSGDIYYYDAKKDSDESNYLQDDEVTLELAEQSAKEISGTLKMQADTKNSLSGTFKVAVCP